MAEKPHSHALDEQLLRFNYGECQSTLLGASLFTLLLLLAIAIVTLVGKWKVYTEDDSDTNYEVL